MRLNAPLLSFALAFALPGALFPQAATTSVFATGLLNPLRLAMTPGGKLLVSEMGPAKNSGRISIINSAAARSTLIEGLPGGPWVTGQPLGPSSMAVAGPRTLYLAIASGDAVLLGNDPTKLTEVPNPVGPASPIISSVLTIKFDADMDTLTSPFALPLAQHFELAEGQEVTLTNAQGAKATVEVLTDLRDYLPDPVQILRAPNPYGLTLHPDHPDVLFMTDGGLNCLVRIDAKTGRARTFAKFPRVNAQMEAVPTSVRPYGSELLVTLFGGVPFTPGESRVVAVNPVTGAVSPFLTFVSSASDAFQAVTERDTDRHFLVLEFSGNLGAQAPPPGRVVLYGPQRQVLSESVVTASGMVQDPANGDVYVAELALGQISRVRRR